MKIQSRTLLTPLGRVLLFVALLVLPTLARGAFYYRRYYVPRQIPRPDHAAVDVPTVALAAFADEDIKKGKGRVIIDRAHDNAVDEADLNVLLARLAARGVETVSLTPGDHLPDMLHNAIALVVVAPHQSFYPWEVEALERFVEQGGRVLLMADPSRYAYRSEYDEWGYEYSIPTSDVAAINSLASTFGMAFADDYIYNTAENAGNYQYVVLKNFAASPLTVGLEEVIFYAAHSLAAGGQALITTDERTTSSLSEQAGDLVTMSLSGDDQVLAVSDFTFMTEPYNTSADNNRLIINIADFLVGAERTYSLTDFPFFFGDQVDLVALMGLGSEDAFSAEVIEQGHILQSAFESTDKTLRWRSEPDDDRDTLFIGLYGGVDFTTRAGKILASRGISFTLETIEQERATPTPTPRFTPTPTPTPRSSPTATPTEEPLRDWISVADMGRIDAKEIALIYHNKEAGHQVVMVLAFAEDGLNAAIQRLIFGDFTRCLLHEDRSADPDVISLAFCPTEYEPSEEGPTPTPGLILTPTPEDDFYGTPTPTLPPPEAEGGILVVADDDGEGIYEWWTSAYDFDSIVADAGFLSTFWSTSLDGEVTLEQMQSYDAVIWCTGDYQEEEFTPSMDDFLNIFAYLADGGRVILSGAFIGSPEESKSGLLLDIQVAQADHPLAEGFEADQVITLERLFADEDYSTFVQEETDSDAIVFTRGPDSEFAGESVISVVEDEFEGSRFLMVGFPIYLMPWEERYQFGTNAVLWLMAEG